MKKSIRSVRIMKQGFLLLLVLFAATSCHSKKEPVQLRDGLYFVSDSISGSRITDFKVFDDTQSSFVDTSCILSLKDLALKMEYDSMLYADTFAVIKINMSAKEKGIWEQKTKPAKHQKVALVLNSQLIQWMVLPDSLVDPDFTLCYCEYSKPELKKVEGMLKR